MTVQEEEGLVHQVVSEMIKNPGKPFYVADVVEHVKLIPVLNRLKAENLVEVPNDQNPYFVRFSAIGLDVARHPNGYNGFKKAQREQQRLDEQAKREKDTLERGAAKATISAAKAAWVAVIASGISIVISFIALNQSSDIDELKEQVKTLQKKFLVMSQSKVDTTSPLPTQALPTATTPQKQLGNKTTIPAQLPAR